MKYQMRCPNCGEKQSWTTLIGNFNEPAICRRCNAILQPDWSWKTLLPQVITGVIIAGTLIWFEDELPFAIEWMVVLSAIPWAILYYIIMPYALPMKFAQHPRARACTNCGYDLYGVKSDACPECGEPHHANELFIADDE